MKLPVRPALPNTIVDNDVHLSRIAHSNASACIPNAGAAPRRDCCIAMITLAGTTMHRRNDGLMDCLNDAY